MINNNVATEGLDLQKHMVAFQGFSSPSFWNLASKIIFFPAITFAWGLCITCLLYFKGTTSSNEIKEKFLALKKATAIHLFYHTLSAEKLG